MEEDIIHQARRYAREAGCFVVRNPLLSAVAFVVGFWALGDPIAGWMGYKENDYAPRLYLLRDLVIVAGAAFALWLAHRRSNSLHEQSKAALDNVVHTRDRMENDQFKDAVKLMATENKDGGAAISARIGGIYILRDLAMHKDRWEEFAPRVIRNLMAYVKENLRRTSKPKKSEMKGKELLALGEDVQAAFRVLNEVLDEHKDELQKEQKIFDRDLSFEGWDFSNLDLSFWVIPNWSHYSWREARFQDAFCFGAPMAQSDFWGANFEGAYLVHAEMQGAKFNYATMEEAILEDSFMQGADFSNAKIRGVYLSDAKMQGVSFQEAEMAETVMHNVDLRGADMSKAQLSGAKLVEASLIFTDFRDAKVADATFPEHKLLNNNIWHSGQENLKQIESLENDADWSVIFEELMEEGLALAGVLRNFGDIDDEEPLTEPGRKLRAAMINMLNDNKMPEDFPVWAECFLRRLNPNGTDKGNQDD